MSAAQREKEPKTAGLKRDYCAAGIPLAVADGC